MMNFDLEKAMDSFNNAMEKKAREVIKSLEKRLREHEKKYGRDSRYYEILDAIEDANAKLS